MENPNNDMYSVPNSRIIKLSTWNTHFVVADKKLTHRLTSILLSLWLTCHFVFVYASLMTDRGLVVKKTHDELAILKLLTQHFFFKLLTWQFFRNDWNTG